jgi:6-phosphogluconolactonase
MTLTYSVLNHARHILRLVTGRGKATMLSRLQTGDHDIPAGRVRQNDALVLADLVAAGSRRQGA